MVAADGGDDLVPRHVKHGAVGDALDAGLSDLVDEALRVLRAGEGLAKAREAEAVVNALAQDAAQQALALEDEDIIYALFLQAQGSRKARRAAAHDDRLLVHHACSPPLT